MHIPLLLTNLLCVTFAEQLLLRRFKKTKKLLCYLLNCLFIALLLESITVASNYCRVSISGLLKIQRLTVCVVKHRMAASSGCAKRCNV